MLDTVCLTVDLVNGPSVLILSLRRLDFQTVDDGLEVYKHDRRLKSERDVEFEITEEQMPKIPRDIVYELNPTGVIKEVTDYSRSP